MRWKYIGFALALCAAERLEAQSADRFSVGRLSKTELVSATRAADGSAERKRYLKATCKEQLDGTRFLGVFAFHDCKALADMFEKADVVSCPAEMVLVNLRGRKVEVGPARPREAGEQCLAVALPTRMVYLVSLNCANPFGKQPPSNTLALARVDTVAGPTKLVHDSTTNRVFLHDTTVVHYRDSTVVSVSRGRSLRPWLIAGGVIAAGILTREAIVLSREWHRNNHPSCEVQATAVASAGSASASAGCGSTTAAAHTLKIPLGRITVH